MNLFSPRISPTSSPFRIQSPPKSADKWELDAEFFTAPSQWTLDQPDCTLDHVFQRVAKAISDGKDYINLIPDSSFPARSSMKLVAQLLQLSAKISHAQKEVRDFALKIIQWVNRVKESFTKAGNGRFTKRTWDNLVSMRVLIDEICSWATERLRDKRWSVSNTKIEAEIRDFQSRMDETEKLFNVRSLIVISGGLDAVLQFLTAIFIGQYVLMNTLKHLHKTQEEHFKHILVEQERQRVLEKNLGPYTVLDSTYTAQKKQPCDPGTRMEILDQIQAWIHDHSKVTSKNFLWLVGPPGCGKSAITTSTVKYCQDAKILSAQFFINRNNHNTTNPNSYFPTVARQLAKHSDPVERRLYETLDRQIYSVDTPQEAAKLFVDIVGQAASSNPDSPVVILFDGLDETSRDSLEDTATIFSQLFTCLREFPNAKVLISSRPEDEILRSFKYTPDKDYIKELLVDIDDPSCHRDIRIFLKRRLTLIAEKRHIPIDWSGDGEVEKLANRASGLFIWAVTACNHINTQFRIRGEEIHRTVLDQFDSKAMKEINMLYRTILDFSYPEDVNDEWIFETFRRLIGAIMVLLEPMKIRDLNALLGLREMPGSDPADIRNFVENLRTLLVPDLDDVTENTFPRAHKSFFDFITPPVTFSPGGTHIFQVWSDKITCVDSYDLGKSSFVAAYQSTYGKTLTYSFDGTKIAHVAPTDGLFPQAIFLHSTVTHTLVSKIPSRRPTESITFLSMSKNCSYMASVSDQPAKIHIWDFGKEYYINCPRSMQHESPVKCVDFSPDETLLISCDEKHAYIWEIPTCNRKPHSFAFHPGGQRSVAFSPDSRTVLAGSKEGVIFLWNPHTGGQIGGPWKIPSRRSDTPVWKVAFRSCGDVALACCDQSVFVWNIHQENMTNMITVIHDIHNAALTLDGSQLLYGDLWKLGICNLAPLLLDSKRTFRPKWTTFSPGGNLVVSVSASEILCWKLNANRVIGNLFKGPTSINAVAFSANETRIAGTSEDGSAYIWDSTTRELLSSLHDCVHGVSLLSFSPDGASIVARLKDNQSVVLTVANGVLSVSSEDESTKALQNVEAAPKSTFFDLDKSPITFGTNPGAPNRRLKNVRWYPSKSDSVVWAYVNNCIIRAGADGSFVVVPVGNPTSSK